MDLQNPSRLTPEPSIQSLFALQSSQQKQTRLTTKKDKDKKVSRGINFESFPMSNEQNPSQDLEEFGGVQSRRQIELEQAFKSVTNSQPDYTPKSRFEDFSSINLLGPVSSLFERRTIKEEPLRKPNQTVLKKFTKVRKVQRKSPKELQKNSDGNFVKPVLYGSLFSTTNKISKDQKRVLQHVKRVFSLNSFKQIENNFKSQLSIQNSSSQFKEEEGQEGATTLTSYKPPMPIKMTQNKPTVSLPKVKNSRNYQTSSQDYKPRLSHTQSFQKQSSQTNFEVNVNSLNNVTPVISNERKNTTNGQSILTPEAQNNVINLVTKHLKATDRSKSQAYLHEDLKKVLHSKRPVDFQNQQILDARLREIKENHRKSFEELERTGSIQQETREKSQHPAFKMDLQTATRSQSIDRVKAQKQSPFIQIVKQNNFYQNFVTQQVQQNEELQHKNQALISLNDLKPLSKISTLTTPFKMPPQCQTLQKDSQEEDACIAQHKQFQLTDDEIYGLLLKSPLRPLIDQIHSFTQLQDPLPVQVSDKPTTQATAYQTASLQNVTRNKRTDALVLDKVIQQILIRGFSGLNSAISNQHGALTNAQLASMSKLQTHISQAVKENYILQTLTKKNDFQSLLSHLADMQKKRDNEELKPTKDQSSIQKCQAQLDKIFYLDSILEKEGALKELVENGGKRKSKQQQKFAENGDITTRSEEETRTFLTQIYKDTSADEMTQLETQLQVLDLDARFGLYRSSLAAIETQAKNCSSNSIIKEKLEKQRQKYLDQIKELFDEVRKVKKDVGEISQDFFADQTYQKNPKQNQTSDQVDQENKNLGTDQLIYLCFLEIVRQISEQCREQSLVLVKLWHQYFDRNNSLMKETLKHIQQKVNKIDHCFDTLQDKVHESLTAQETKESQVLEIAAKYDQALNYIKLLSKGLHEERKKNISLESKIKYLKDEIHFLLPNYESYKRDSYINKSLMINDLHGTKTIQEQIAQRMDQPYKDHLNSELEFLPEQALLYKDSSRLQTILTFKLPFDYETDLLQQKLKTEKKKLKHQSNEMTQLQEEICKQKAKNKELEKQFKLTNLKFGNELQQITIENEAKIKEKVKEFAYDQMIDRLKNVKEVQTDQYLLDECLREIEQERELGYSLFLKHHQLKHYQGMQLKVIQSFNRQPKFVFYEKPIHKLIRIVRENKSRQVPKPLAKTSILIAEILQQRLRLSDEPTHNYKIDKMPQESYFYRFIQQKYGVNKRANLMCEQWLVSIKHHLNRNVLIDIFSRFIGLNGANALPFSIFTYFLELLKITNIDFNTLFSQPLHTLYMPYLRVKNGLKDIYQKTNLFIRHNMNTQIQSNSQVMTINPVIYNNFTIIEYETLLLLRELIGKKAEYKSIPSFLKAMFEKITGMQGLTTFYDSPIVLLKKGLKGTNIAQYEKSSPATSNKDNFQDKISQDFQGNKSENSSSYFSEGDDEDQVEQQDQYGSENDQEFLFSPSAENTTHKMLRMTATNSIDGGASSPPPTQQIAESGKQEQTPQKSQIVERRQTRIREAERQLQKGSTIRLDQMVSFIADEFDLSSDDTKRMNSLLQILVVMAQGADPLRITRNEAIRGLTEKVEINIPVDAFLHIGINAMVDHENTENTWLEQVFNFYSQLKPVTDVFNEDEEPDYFITFRDDLNFYGMEFVSFYIFVKDGGSKQKDKVFIYQIYEDQCLHNNRQRLSCDDFVDMVRKFNLIKSKLAFENQMNLRYEQAKTRKPRLEFEDKSTQIRRFVCDEANNIPKTPNQMHEKSLRNSSQPSPQSNIAEAEDKNEQASQTLSFPNQTITSKFNQRKQMRTEKQQYQKHLVKPMSAYSTSNIIQLLPRDLISSIMENKIESPKEPRKSSSLKDFINSIQEDQPDKEEEQKAIKDFEPPLALQSNSLNLLQGSNKRQNQQKVTHSLRDLNKFIRQLTLNKKNKIKRIEGTQYSLQKDKGQIIGNQDPFPELPADEIESDSFAQDDSFQDGSTPKHIDDDASLEEDNQSPDLQGAKMTYMTKLKFRDIKKNSTEAPKQQTLHQEGESRHALREKKLTRKSNRKFRSTFDISVTKWKDHSEVNAFQSDLSVNMEANSPNMLEHSAMTDQKYTMREEQQTRNKDEISRKSKSRQSRKTLPNMDLDTCLKQQESPVIISQKNSSCTQLEKFVNHPKDATTLVAQQSNQKTRQKQFQKQLTIVTKGKSQNLDKLKGSQKNNPKHTKKAK